MYWKNSSSGEVFWGYFKIYLYNEYVWKDLKKKKKKGRKILKNKEIKKI